MQLSEIVNSSTNSTGQQKQSNQTLGKDDFLKLLVTQLKNQDPLKPMEDREFIAQTAQFSSLEQIQNLNKTLEEGLGYLQNTQENLLHSFNSWQSMGNSFAMIGKEIIGFNTNGDEISGVVEKIKVTEAGPVAVVNGEKIKIDSITEISVPVNDSNNENTENEVAGEA